MYRVTFTNRRPFNGKYFYNVERFENLDDARLRAYALNWRIVKVETLPEG